LSGLVGDDIVLGEPQGDFLLGVLDGVRAVADVAADVLAEVLAFYHWGQIGSIGTYNSIVTTDGPWVGSKGVGSTEKSWK
jgi:hypothetical protein